MAIQINAGECVSCGACVDTCPAGALELGAESVEVDEGACVDCGACVDACPVSALSL